MSVALSAIFSFFLQFFTKAFVFTSFRIAITLAFITMVVGAVYAYVAAAGVLITALSSTVPDIVNGVWGWVMPSNTSICLVSLMAATILRFVTAHFLLLFKAKHQAAISGS
jgi:Family of unknown function (DUF5455)